LKRNNADLNLDRFTYVREEERGESTEERREKKVKLSLKQAVEAHRVVRRRDSHIF
jgi:hypothetical protein